MIKKYALLGEKLSHSHSPLIHKEIMQDMGIHAEYELLELTREKLGKTIDLLKEGLYQGFNVTIPYKTEIMQYLDVISDEAREIGSVNTIAYQDGKAIGYNTDYYGFYNQLLFYQVDVKEKDCFILGTGGASLAVYKALKDLGGNVKFVSRNPKKKNTISYAELASLNIDVIVNTTPVGMYPNVGVSPLPEEIVCKAGNVLDIIFNPLRTRLLELADSPMNGLYMLVGQAVKAEEIWQNKKYPYSTEELLKRIEAVL